MNGPASGQHCVGCGSRTSHFYLCDGAWKDERAVVCLQCDEEFKQPEMAAAHSCHTARVPASQARVVFGFDSPRTGTMVFLEDGTVLQRVGEGQGGWLEREPVARTFRAATIPR